MKNIELLGEGKGGPFKRPNSMLPGVIHSDGNGFLHTLCGIFIYQEEGSVNNFRYVNEKINCPLCIEKILFCKKIPNKSLHLTASRKGTARGK